MDSNVKKLIIDGVNKQVTYAPRGFLDAAFINELVETACEAVKEETDNFSYQMFLDLTEVIYVDDLALENSNTMKFLQHAENVGLLKYKSVTAKLYESQVKLIDYVRNIANVNGWVGMKLNIIPVANMYSESEESSDNYFNLMLDLKNKQILGEVVGVMSMYRGSCFVNDLQDMVNGIDSVNFRLVLDCTKMRTISKPTFEQFRACCDLYVSAAFKSITVILTKDQVELRRRAILIGDNVPWEFKYIDKE